MKTCILIILILYLQANHEHVFLQGEDKIYLNMGDSSQKPSHLESHVSVGNKLWQMIPISHSYLASNWPIRVSCGL